MFGSGLSWLFLDLMGRVGRELGPGQEQVPEAHGGLPTAETELVARKAVEREYLHIEKRLDKLALVVQAMWSLVAEKSSLTETDLLRRVTELDAQDGAMDGRVTKPPVPCPKCDAMICRKFNRCLFCGQEYTGGSAFDTV